MAQQTVDAADTLNAGRIKINSNFTELYESTADLQDQIDGLVLTGDNEYQEYANLAAFPVTGETDLLYVAIDTGFTYRWSGSAYVQIGGSTVSDASDTVKGIVELATTAETTTGTDTARAVTPAGVKAVADLKADLASPAFTGNPTATTQSPGNNSTRIATTAYVDAAISAIKTIQLACSDETSVLTTGTAKVTFRMPYAMTVTAVRASLNVAQTSGSILTVDINESGASILSTKLTIDNTETTSTTAAAPAVISDASLADDAIITIDIDQVGDGTAKGLKITLIGI